MATRATGFGGRGSRRAAPIGLFLTGLLAVLAAAAALVASVGPAEAVPSFARQTGQPCAACHTAFPELTPFGRRFKLGGYTLQGGDLKLPPVAAMIMPSFTNTKAPLDAGTQPPGLATNNNVVTQQVTGFLPGDLYGNLGSFIQVTGDPVGGGFILDASELRYANEFNLFGKDTIWGITVNNTPTVQDVWNTTPAFGWPEIASTIAPAFGPPLTHIESGYGQIVGGAGAYIFWNDMLYAELTGYHGLSEPILEAFGQTGASGVDKVESVAPYWRLALEPHWGEHYLMVGTFGMYGQVVPGRVFGYGYDDYLDIGLDSQYQYDGDQYSVTVKLTDIIEKSKLNASYALGNASNLENSLNSFKANASFVWDHTYSLSAGYFNISGKSDPTLYTLAYGGPGVVSSPDGNGLIFEVAYLPFSHGSPWPYSTWNARLGVQYTQYLQLYGGNNNFDKTGLGGTHNASGNNTVFLYAWLAF